MMRRWIRLLAALLAMGLLLTGCSGDDDGDGGDDAETGAGTTIEGPGDEPAADLPCDADVCLSGILFAPDAIEVAVGDTVTWESVDSPDHTVTADDGSFDSGTMSNGDTFEHTFDEAGSFSYTCLIHRSMTGTVTVS